MIVLDDDVSILATNSGGTDVTVTLDAGSYYLTAAGGVPSFIALLQAALIADAPPATGTWTVSFSTTTGQVTIECTGAGTWSLTWSTTVVMALLGFTANLSAVTGAQTGTSQAHGVWFPDCPVTLAGQLERAPRASDLRTSRSPRGRVLGLIGNTWAQHKGCSWSHVPYTQIREASATLVNGSWEKFFDETQLGMGMSCFKPSSLIQVYTHNGVLIGSDGNSGSGMRGWSIEGLASNEVERSVEGWDGLWRVTLPILVGEFN